MAALIVQGDDLVVRLSPLEKLGAFRGDVRVPLGAVGDLRAIDDLWPELRGVRAPGTGLPGVIALGTRRGGGIVDFAAVYGHRPGVVIDLKHATPFSRLVVSCRDAQDQDRVMNTVAEAVNSRGQAPP
jgi:hypothetical protein